MNYRTFEEQVHSAKRTVLVNLLKHKGDKDVANIDKTLVVCSALTNYIKLLFERYMQYSTYIVQCHVTLL